MKSSFIVDFSQIGMKDLSHIGIKNAPLDERHAAFGTPGLF